jgi:hypothetical protein
MCFSRTLRSVESATKDGDVGSRLRRSDEIRNLLRQEFGGNAADVLVSGGSPGKRDRR